MADDLIDIVVEVDRWIDLEPTEVEVLVDNIAYACPLK